MDSITFYVDKEDIVCDFNCENIDNFKVLLITLFSGSLTETTMGYITNKFTNDGRLVESKISRLILDQLVSQRPIIEASEFK